VKYSGLIQYSLTGNVASIVIDRPERKNALDVSTLAELNYALRRAQDDAAVRVVVLSGAGGSFCAGADLAARDTPADAVEVIEQHYKPVFMSVAELSKPVIGAVDGAAAGAGSALAMLCDLTVMARDAYLLFAFSNLGLIPDCGANWLLERALGSKRAYQLAIEGGRLSAQQCEKMGLANKVTPSGEALSVALEWAQALSARAPLSLSLTKTVMRRSPDSTYSAVVSLEGELQRECTSSEDFREGLAAFFERRSPVFNGR